MQETKKAAIKVLQDELELYKHKVKHLEETIKILKESDGEPLYVTGSTTIPFDKPPKLHTLSKEPNHVYGDYEEVYDDGYSKKLHLRDKLMYFLKQENRFLQFREVAELIIKKEGLDKSLADNLTSKLSAVSLKLKKEKVIVKYQASKSKKHVFWGSPKWLDENGVPKKEHACNEDVLNNDTTMFNII